MSERISIGRINGAEIYAVKNESGEIHVPIKPICEAIGIAFQAQNAKIKEDYVFASTATIIVTVGSDGKDREMVCLPLKHVCGWLYTINPGKVAPEARDVVIRYREECNELLTSYFFGMTLRQIESNNAEIAALEKITALLSEEKSIKCQLKDARERLSKIRTARLDATPTLFD